MPTAEVKTNSGYVVFIDPEALTIAYGGHGLRVTAEGDIQILMITTDSVEWSNLEDLDLVQPVGKPAKAGKQ